MRVYVVMERESRDNQRCKDNRFRCSNRCNKEFDCNDGLVAQSKNMSKLRSDMFVSNIKFHLVSLLSQSNCL